MTDKHIIHEHAHVSLSRFGVQVGNGSKLPKLINWDWETKYTKNYIQCIYLRLKFLLGILADNHESSSQ